MAVKINTLFKHKQLSKFNPGICSLLLDISNNQGKLAIADTHSETLLFLVVAECTDNESVRDLLFTLKEKLPCEPTDFASCKLMFYTSTFELVPDEWFDPGERDYYLILHQKEISTLPTNINRLDELKINLLAAVPPYVKTAMDIFNGVFALYHSGTVLINKFRMELSGKKTSLNKVFCSFFKDGIEILIPDNNTIRYYNQIITSDPDETLFFLLNTIHSLEYANDYGIDFSGDIGPKSAVITTLKKAIPNISLAFNVTLKTEKYTKGSKGLNQLQLDNIFYLLACE